MHAWASTNEGIYLIHAWASANTGIYLIHAWTSANSYTGIYLIHIWVSANKGIQDIPHSCPIVKTGAVGLLLHAHVSELSDIDKAAFMQIQELKDVLNGQCDIIGFTLEEVENMMCDICVD